jgi:hypothetical protein
MIGRNRRGNRQASMKARVGIATAVLVGGSAVGVAAVAAASHGPATTNASSAGFTLNFHHTISEQAALSSALSTWGTSHQRSLTTLAEMAPMRTFSQVWKRHTEFAVQRGVVVLATRKFLLVQSANGGLHLWWIKGSTQFLNVSTTMTGMAALTGSTTAAKAAMVSNNMTPAATAVAGSTAAVNQMMAPVSKPTTITVSTGTQTITITITSSTATVTQPVTTPTATATVSATPTPTATATQPTFTMAHGIARGDLVLVAGLRIHGQLIAKLVIFAAPNTGTTPTPTPPVTPTSTSTSTSTFSGIHS